MLQALNGQEVASDIAKRLRQRFTTQQFKEIYKDKPVQGMVTPCIFIHLVNTEQTRQMRNYWWREYLIDIRCHPPDMKTNTQTWSSTVAEMVVDCLTTITVSGQPVHCKDSDWHLEDNVLHVMLKYAFRVRKTAEEIPDMQDLTYGENIKYKE